MSRNSRSHRRLVSLKCPPPGNREMIAPGDSDKEKHKEVERSRRFYKQILNILKQKGIQIENIKQFMSLLRKYSLKEYCSGPDYYGILKKEDRKELLDFLYEQTETKNDNENRSITRADYNSEDAILTNFAADYPDLMRSIAKLNFSSFSFCSKINKKDIVIAEWNRYINEIQELIKNANLVTEVNENANISSIPNNTNSNQEVLQSTNDTSIPLTNRQQIPFNEIKANLDAFNRMPLASAEFEIPRTSDDEMDSELLNNSKRRTDFTDQPGIFDSSPYQGNVHPFDLSVSQF